MLHQPGDSAHGWAEPELGRRGAWVQALGLGIVLAGAYFLAARIGLALEPEGVAVLWPAAGVAAGALIVLGRRARAPIAVGVLGATVAANMSVGGPLWAALTFGLCNAGEAVLAAWLVDRWCGRPFQFDEWRALWAFLAAAALASAVAGLGAAVAMQRLHPTAALHDIWRTWVAAHGLGIVTVAPLLVGLYHLTEAPVSRSRSIEGTVALALLAATTFVVYARPSSSGLPRLPEAVLFPILLWIAARCQPVFAAAAVCIISAILVGAATFHIGQFADSPPPAASVQVMVLVGSLCTFTLSALFSDRSRGEAALRESNERLRLALGGAKLGVWSVHLGTDHFETDERNSRITGLDPAAPPRTLTEARKYLHPDDVPHLDAAFATARRTGEPCRVEFRVVGPRPDGHARVRWAAMEGTAVRDAAGHPVRLLGVTRDITERRLAKQALAERTAQLALAGRAGLVGCFAYDIASGVIQISAGFAAIYGLPETTTEVPRADWRTWVHPDDIGGLEARRGRAIASRQREFLWEYRIRRPDGEVRWIEQRSLIAYDDAGAARRVVGVHIDVTERKRNEEHKSLLLAELDHRVKNVLAVVTALVSRTCETSGTEEELVAALDGRIKSMATTHELLSDRKWHGLSLGELIERELEPYATGSNLTIGGPDVVLNAEAGQALAMVVHELVTNAAKYGALSVRRGRVAVRWRHVAENGAGAHVALDWRESDGPAVAPSSRAGYGTSVIRDLIPYELGGKVDLALPREGVRCRLQVPAKWLSDAAAPSPAPGTHARQGYPLRV